MDADIRRSAADIEMLYDSINTDVLRGGFFVQVNMKNWLCRGGQSYRGFRTGMPAA